MLYCFITEKPPLHSFEFFLTLVTKLLFCLFQVYFILINTAAGFFGAFVIITGMIRAPTVTCSDLLDRTSDYKTALNIGYAVTIVTILFS